MAIDAKTGRQYTPRPLYWYEAQTDRFLRHLIRHALVRHIRVMAYGVLQARKHTGRR